MHFVRRQSRMYFEVVNYLVHHVGLDVLDGVTLQSELEYLYESRSSRSCAVRCPCLTF